MAAKNGPTSIEKKQIIGMAEQEMEYRVELFNRLTKTCFDKCIKKRYEESELYIGDSCLVPINYQCEATTTFCI